MRSEEKKKARGKKVITTIIIIITFIAGFAIGILGMQGPNKSTNNENRTEQTSTHKKAKKQSSATKKEQDTNISVTIQSPDTSKGKKAESEQKPDTRKQDAGEMDAYYKENHLNPQPEEDDSNWAGSHYSEEDPNENSESHSKYHVVEGDEMDSQSTYSISTPVTTSGSNKNQVDETPELDK